MTSPKRRIDPKKLFHVQKHLALRKAGVGGKNPVLGDATLKQRLVAARWCRERKLHKLARIIDGTNGGETHNAVWSAIGGES